jgi:DNA-binding PadR family transcriptional regulator
MGEKNPRVSAQGLKVLHAFVQAGATELSGAEIYEKTGILSGTLYPILIRYRGVGWLEDRWEDNEPIELGRPKRRYYRLTAEGQRAYQRNLPDPAMGGILAWAR